MFPNFKDIYTKMAFSGNFLKLTRLFHFTKIFPKELEIKESEKCLVLAPHPDDETMGCAGLLFKYPENIHIACLTDGRHGGYNTDENELKQIRKDEFENVMKKAGITSYSFLDIEDRELINNYEIFSTMPISSYDYIFLPNNFDQHKDHKATTILLQKLLKEKKYKNNLKIAFYEVWSALTMVNYFIDITSSIEWKKDLINIYKSQIKHVDFISGILGLNAYRGMQSNKKYSEAYSIIDVKTFLRF